MKLRVSSKLNPTQSEFLQDEDSPFLHFSGGFGSGKTYALCMKALKLSYLNRKAGPGGLVVIDYQEFKRDVLPEMEAILERNNIKFKYHGTDHYFEFPWTRHKLYVATSDKKIRGPNWAYAVINEVTLIPLIRYKEVIGRVRVKNAVCPQVASVGTPEGFASEYYEYFIETPPDGLRILYGSSDENKENLSEVYLANLDAAYDSKMIETYRKGFWVNMTGNRFYYSFDPVKSEDKRLTVDLFSSFKVSMDFNVDPFTATIWGYDGYKLYGVGQINLEGEQGFNTQNMIEALKARGFVPGNTEIYPDPAGQARSTKGESDVNQLRKAGYTVHVKKAAPNFRKRQLNVNNLLDKGRIQFNPDQCKGVRKDLMAVEQDVVTQAKKKENPKLTHFSDGLDYLCDFLFPFSGDAKATTVNKFR